MRSGRCLTRRPPPAARQARVGGDLGYCVVCDRGLIRLDSLPVEFAVNQVTARGMTTGACQALEARRRLLARPRGQGRPVITGWGAVPT